ncbi:MAG: AAA family ATPase [Chloroflexi bacterium]|nr:AAA family ATPase [Chloroflexota bacterium]
MPHLSLSFLGGFEVALDGEPITAFGTDKVRALLAYLAIESARPHRRTELAALLWPDLPDIKAAHNLSQTLLRLRRALREPDARTPSDQPPVLLLTSQTIQFNLRCDHQLDVSRFAELLKARRQHQHPTGETCPVCLHWLHQTVELYRGDLLAGFLVRDSVAFEEWRMVKQEALHSQVVSALDQLVVDHERRAEYDRMQVYARRQTALDPWREEAHLQLMRALALGDQPAAALEQYESYCYILEQELGVQPSAKATALVDQIRSGALKSHRPDRFVALNGPNERRQVTALICSRGNLAAHGDPEALYEQLAACEPQCENILARFDGQRAPRHGGECLIYFGYPTSHEDNARRAVDASLALAAAHTAPARIGLHTGMMIVSKRRGTGATDAELVGEVPSLARICRDLAEPGVVLLTEATEQLVRGRFDLKSRGTHTLLGLGRPLIIYEADSASGQLGRPDQIQHLTPLIGRAAELAQVLTCLDKVRHGQGQTVLVSGQAGIGKSRLMWELKNATLAQRSHSPLIWLESRCSPYFQNTSLWPIIRLLEQRLGFEEDDSLELKREKLVKTLARYDLTHAAAVWHLALLLGLPDESPIPTTITAEQREGMRVAFVALLQKQAAEQPLALMIEDLHWSDPSTLEWLDRSFDSLTAAPCLVLLTYRPTFTPAWLPRASSNLLTLGPLSVAQTESMVADLAGVGQLRAEIRQRIVHQADGIPLFVEELTKTLLESDEPDIPATLRDSLMARLDHLGDARQTAQWAAALGREFSYPVLSAVTAFDGQRLHSDLARLVAAELIVPPGRGTHGRYAFKHALVQEAAQASLLKRNYQDFHRRIAETLEARFAQIAETQPEVIAQH